MSSVLNDDIDYEPLYKAFLIDLKKYGIEIETKDIHWKGFGHQGDGLSFDFKLTNKDDSLKFLKAIELDVVKNIDFVVANLFEVFDIYTAKNPFSNAYCHEKTRTITINYEYVTDHKFNSLIQSTEEFITNWYINKCQEYYQLLEDHYNEEREEDDIEREEWDDEITISDRIDAMVDPEMGIEKVVELINDTRSLANTPEEKVTLINKFIENFNKEYMIIKKN